MTKKLLTIPVIPKWLANQIEATKVPAKSIDSSDDFVLCFLLRANHAVAEDYDYPTSAGKYIAEHIIDVAIAIKYGYEVEDEN